VKKKLMLGAFLLSAIMPYAARAAETAAPSALAGAAGSLSAPTDINLASLFENVREGTMIAFSPNGMTLATAYAPLVVLHDRAADGSDPVEYASLGAGYCLNVANTKASPLIMIGVRPDNLPALLKSSLHGSLGKWVRNNLSFAKLPPMEMGLAGSWYAPDHIWILGLTIAVKLGK